MKVSQLINKAKRCKKGGDLHGALELFLQVLREKPGNATALNSVLELAQKLNNADAFEEGLTIRARTQPSIEACCELGLLHLKRGNNGKALGAFEAALEVDPNDKTALYLAAKWNTAMAKYPRAVAQFERFLENYPPNIMPTDGLVNYVHAVSKSFTSTKSPDEIIRWALPYLKDHPGAVRYLISTAEQTCEHQLVHELYEQLLMLLSPENFRPYDWVNWIRSLTLLKAPIDPGAVVDQALSALDSYPEKNVIPQYYTMPDIHMARARVLYLAGRDHRPALDACLSVPGFSKGLATLRSTSEIVESTYHRNFAEWQNRLKGMDVCILANGPSLRMLEDVREDLAVSQKTRFVVFNDFEKIIGQILMPIGRGVDGITMLSSVSFDRHIENVLGLLSTPSCPFLITVPTLIESQARAEELGQFDGQFMLMNSRFHLPPTPGNGLNFEFINSLGVAISMLLTAEPERIFLFGADGGSKAVGEDVYFGGKQRPEAAKDATINEIYLNQLAREAELMDAILEFQLPVAAEMYEVALPKIYNVCPTSNYGLFEKVDISAAIRLLTEGTEAGQATVPRRKSA